SVPPIYMPGRRRTGSSPSRTSMSLAEYVACAGALPPLPPNRSFMSCSHPSRRTVAAEGGESQPEAREALRKTCLVLGVARMRLKHPQLLIEVAGDLGQQVGGIGVSGLVGGVDPLAHRLSVGGEALHQFRDMLHGVGHVARIGLQPGLLGH